MGKINAKSNTKISLTRQFKNLRKEIQEDLRNCEEQSTWEALQHLKKAGEIKLQEIIRDNFYKVRPEPVAYERTYQFLNCGVIEITHGHGTYNLRVWLDAGELNFKPPAEPNFYPSYGYKFEGKQVFSKFTKKGDKVYRRAKKAGEELDPTTKENLVKNWDIKYNILDEFNDWVHKVYPELFEERFRINLRKINVIEGYKRKFTPQEIYDMAHSNK